MFVRMAGESPKIKKCQKKNVKLEKMHLKIIKLKNLETVFERIVEKC